MEKTTKKAAGKKPSATVNGEPVHVEEVSQQVEPTKMVALVTPEQKAKQEIARFDLARTWITKKKKEFAALPPISSPEDKEGIKKHTAAWQEMRNKRLAVEKKHKEIKSDYLVITRIIDGEKNDLVKMLQEDPGGENALGAELDRIENLKKEEAAKLERQAEERLQGRVAELLGNGIQFNGSYYAIGDAISMDVVSLKLMSDEKYSEFLTRVKAEHDLQLKEKERVAEAARKEAEELQRQKDEQEKTRQAQEAAQKEIARQKAELETQQKAMLEQRTSLRAAQLEGLGMTYNYGLKRWEYITKDSGGYSVDKTLVEETTPEEWGHAMQARTFEIKRLKDAQEVVDNNRQKLAEAQEKQRQAAQAERDAEEARQKYKSDRFQHRVKLLMSLFSMFSDANIYKTEFGFNIPPMTIEKAHIMDLDDADFSAAVDILRTQWNNSIFKEKEAKAEADKKAEEARNAALSDAQRVREWVNNWVEAGAKRPEISNEFISKEFTRFDENVAGLVEALLDALDLYEKE